MISKQREHRCIATWLFFGMIAYALIAAAPCLAQDAAAQPQAAGGIDTRIDGTVSVENMTLGQLIQILQTESGMQFVPGPVIDRTVTFSMTNPSVREILQTVLPANGLAFHVTSDGVVRIDTREAIDLERQPDLQTLRRTFFPRYRRVADLQEAISGMKSPQGLIIFDVESNSIYVEDTPQVIEAIESLLFHLDTETQTRVFVIRYANAGEIAEQLLGVVNTQDGEMFVDLRNNLIIITDAAERLNQAAMIIEQLDRKLEFRVIPLAFALPEDVLPLAEQLLTEMGFIDFDPRTSRIIIRDIPSIVDMIVELIQLIDIPPQQVYIEADIVQILDDDAFTFGTSASFGEDIGRGNDPSFPQIGNATGQFFSFNPFLTTSGTGLTLLDVNRGSYRVQIDAMVERKLAEVIASPRLLVEDGGLGSFTLGSQEPFAVRQQQSYWGGSGSGGDYFTQQFREVGTSVMLEVYASEAGYVNMFINIEDTRARRVNLANLGDSLAVDGSFIDTSVTVKSNRTVVLGGIINRRTESSRSGVPVLSSIPVLGNLFSNRSKSNQKQKLLIFITPRLVNIDDPYDFAQVDNYQRIMDLQTSGATGFIDNQVDQRYLDWSAEREYEREAIQDALQEMESSPSRNNNQRPPSLDEQIESGVLRVVPPREN